MFDIALSIAQGFLALFFFAAGLPRSSGVASTAGSASTTFHGHS